MTDVSDLVDAFKREVAVPGTFATAFPSTAESDIVGALMDSFGEAQLDGFFPTMVLDVDGEEISPDLSTAGAALVVMYAGARLLRNQLRVMSMTGRYVAGPVSYEASSSASVLAALLKSLDDRRKAIIENARRNAGASTFFIDAYRARGFNDFYGGFFPYEVAGSTIWGI